MTRLKGPGDAFTCVTTLTMTHLIYWYVGVRWLRPNIVVVKGKKEWSYTSKSLALLSPDVKQGIYLTVTYL